METPKMGERQTPEAKESTKEKLQRAEIIRLEIQRVTKEWHEKKRLLSTEFSEIAKEVSKNVPKIYCSSMDPDAESGNYYVIGLPEGTNLEKVQLEKNSRHTELMIDGKEYEGDWYSTETEEEVLEELLRLHKETEK